MVDDSLFRQAVLESGDYGFALSTLSKVGDLDPLQIMTNVYKDYADSTKDIKPYQSVTNLEQAIKVRNCSQLQNHFYKYYEIHT